MKKSEYRIEGNKMTTLTAMQRYENIKHEVVENEAGIRRARASISKVRYFKLLFYYASIFRNGTKFRKAL